MGSGYLITINEGKNFEFDLDHIQKILGHYVTLMRFDEKGKNPDGWQLAVPPKYLSTSLGSFGVAFHNDPRDRISYFFITVAIEGRKAEEILKTVKGKLLKSGIPKSEIKINKATHKHDLKINIYHYEVDSKQKEQKIIEAVAWIAKYLKQGGEKRRGRM